MSLSPRILVSSLGQHLRPLLQTELAVLVGVSVPEGVLQGHKVPPLPRLLLLKGQETAAHVAGNLEAAGTLMSIRINYID